MRPNLHRRNLELMTETHVRRILLEGGRAVGVEVERGGRIERVRARREIVLSGGAINSPVLLLATAALLLPGGLAASTAIGVRARLLVEGAPLLSVPSSYSGKRFVSVGSSFPR